MPDTSEAEPGERGRNAHMRAPACRTARKRNRIAVRISTRLRKYWETRGYDLGGCSLLLVRISSVKTGWSGSVKDMERVGGAVQGARPTQGISPFEERAGAAEWQTSSVPKNERPSFTAMNVNEVMGARTVNARTIRRMNVIDFIFEV
jgi:hypothetical protein